MPRNRRITKKKNPLPLLAIGPFVVGAKIWIPVAVGGLISTYAVARNIVEDAGQVPEVDSAVFDSLASRQDYAALMQFFSILNNLAEENHTFKDFNDLKAAYGGASPGALKTPAETVVMAHLIAAIYIMEAYLLSGDADARKQAIELVNGINKVDLNPTTAPQRVREVLMNAYKLILGVQFTDSRSKFRVINNLSGTLSILGIEAAQFDQANIDMIVQEEVLMAKCKSEKPFGAILAALSFQPKPVCYTDEQWFYYKLAAWAGLTSIAGLLLSGPLQVLGKYGEMLGTVTSSIKSKNKR